MGNLYYCCLWRSPSFRLSGQRFLICAVSLPKAVIFLLLYKLGAACTQICLKFAARREQRGELALFRTLDT